MNKSDLRDEELECISGGTMTRGHNTKECIYCGGVMKLNTKGKQTGGTYICQDCGAAYNPSLPNPWRPEVMIIRED